MTINPLFGNLAHYRYVVGGTSTLDAILDSIPIANPAPTIGVDVQGAITDCGNSVNRSFVLAWRNAGNTFCWALVMNFSGLYYAIRINSSTYSIAKVN